MSKASFYHGVALVRIIHHDAYETLRVYIDNNSSYLVNKDIGIYIKYSEKKLPPWIFTFSEEHIMEIVAMTTKLKNIYISLVCNEDGVCCLNWHEFATIISVDDRLFPKWIRITRMKNEKYSVFGKDGKLKHKVGNIDFPKKIFL